MMGADNLLASVKSCSTSCQEGEQLNLVVIDTEKLLPVSRNGIMWLNTSTNSLPSLAACFSLQTFRKIFISHHIQAAAMT